MEQGIEVEGLKPIQAGFEKVAAEAEHTLTDALTDVGNLFVKTVKPKVPVRTGAAQRSVVAQATNVGVMITAGSQKVQYFAWLDFGGKAGRNHSVHRLVVRDGRYMYPTVHELQPKVTTTIEKQLAELIASAGLKEV